MITTKIEAYEKGHLRLVQAEQLKVGPREVLLKTLYSTISPGTELAWLNHMENTPGEYPYYPGYSACCRIEEIGLEVEGFSVGDIVVSNTKHWSHHILEANQCIPVPETLKPCEVSAYRLAAISLQGVRKADIQIGDDVAVLGLGAIGNYAAQLSYVAGAGTVSGFDLVDWRRDIANECGIKQLYTDGMSEEFENKYDVVFEVTGVPEVINTALHMVKPLGKVIILGSTRGLTDGVNFYRDIHRKGITVVGAHEMHRSQNEADRFGHFRSKKEDEKTVIRLLEAGRITLAPLISTVVAPHEAQDIYNRLLNKNEHLLLATFDWDKLEV